MKALENWTFIFRSLGWVCLVLLGIIFFLSSPIWESGWFSPLVCLIVVFFVASISLNVVKRAIQELKQEAPHEKK